MSTTTARISQPSPAVQVEEESSLLPESVYHSQGRTLIGPAWVMFHLHCQSDWQPAGLSVSSVGGGDRMKAVICGRRVLKHVVGFMYREIVYRKKVYGHIPNYFISTGIMVCLFASLHLLVYFQTFHKELY